MSKTITRRHAAHDAYMRLSPLGRARTRAQYERVMRGLQPSAREREETQSDAEYEREERERLAGVVVNSRKCDSTMLHRLADWVANASR